MSFFNPEPISNDWIRGFVEAEGSFYFYFVNSFSSSPTQGKAAFSIVQKATDENKNILNLINNTIKGKIYLKKNSYEFRIENQQILFDLVFPFKKIHYYLQNKWI
jgi:hypothetical protein